MKLKTIFQKNFIKKYLLKVFFPYLISILRRKKTFKVIYRGKEILLNSLVYDQDIMYHHFHAYYRSGDNFSKNTWERTSIDLSADASLYIDIGGYNGIFGLLAAKMNKNIKVHIFEPNPLSAYIIHTNIELNKSDNITLHQAAVGNVNKLVPIMIQKNGSRVDFTVKNNFIMLNCVTIDSLADTLDYKDFEKVVIKMDAEGFEKECLEGMREFIKKCRSLDILLTIHTKIRQKVHGKTNENFFDFVRKLGFIKVGSEDVGEGVELHIRK